MKFDIGDRVQVVNPYSGGNFNHGDIVEIVHVVDGDCYRECYGAISSHDNILWFLYEDEVMPINN